MARTDICSPTGFLVRCIAQTSPLFIVEYGAPNGSTNQSTHTSVFCGVLLWISYRLLLPYIVMYKLFTNHEFTITIRLSQTAAFPTFAA